MDSPCLFVNYRLVYFTVLQLGRGVERLTCPCRLQRPIGGCHHKRKLDRQHEIIKSCFDLVRFVLLVCLTVEKGVASPFVRGSSR